MLYPVVSTVDQSLFVVSSFSSLNSSSCLFLDINAAPPNPTAPSPKAPSPAYLTQSELDPVSLGSESSVVAVDKSVKDESSVDWFSVVGLFSPSDNVGKSSS